MLTLQANHEESRKTLASEMEMLYQRDRELMRKQFHSSIYNRDDSLEMFYRKNRGMQEQLPPNRPDRSSLRDQVLISTLNDGEW